MTDTDKGFTIPKASPAQAGRVLRPHDRFVSDAELAEAEAIAHSHPHILSGVKSKVSVHAQVSVENCHALVEPLLDADERFAVTVGEEFELAETGPWVSSPLAFYCDLPTLLAIRAAIDVCLGPVVA